MIRTSSFLIGRAGIGFDLCHSELLWIDQDLEQYFRRAADSSARIRIRFDPTRAQEYSDISMRTRVQQTQIHLEWAGSNFVLDPTNRTGEASFSGHALRDREATRRICMSSAVILAHGLGVFHLHAAAIGMGDRAALLVGASGSGKSTTASVLSTKGFAFMSDDQLLLSREGSGIVVEPGPRAWLRLFPESLEKVGSDGWRSRSQQRASEEKVEVAYRDLGFALATRLRPSLVLVVGRAERTHWAPVDPGVALRVLSKESMCLGLRHGRNAEQLELLRELACSSKAYQLKVGPDFLEDPKPVTDWLGQELSS